MGTGSGKGTTVKRKRYSRKFQRMAVERLLTCDDVGELARELGVTRRCLYKWRTRLEVVEPGEEASRPSTHTASYRKEIQKLKRLLQRRINNILLSYRSTWNGQEFTRTHGELTILPVRDGWKRQPYRKCERGDA